MRLGLLSVSKLLAIGGCRFIDCAAAILENGVEVIRTEVSDEGQALLTIDVYDEHQRHVGKLRRNAWVFNDAGYVITTPPALLELKPNPILVRRPEMTWVRAAVLDADEIRVEGQFYTPLGRRIAISQDTVLIDASRSSVPEPRQEGVKLTGRHVFRGGNCGVIAIEQDSFRMVPGKPNGNLATT